MAKTNKQKEQPKICSRCRSELKGQRYEEIVTHRRTKLFLCMECVKRGL